MPKRIDFREVALSPDSLRRSGRYIGSHTYWKLYSVENIFRVVIHSILTPNIPQDWWTVAVDPTIQAKASRFRTKYINRAWHGKPGVHNIYYIDLKDLNEIIRANANLFVPVIPNIDKWMVGIEDMRLPRNIVAHMNFPDSNDQKRIDVFHSDCLSLLAGVGAKIQLLVP